LLATACGASDAASFAQGGSSGPGAAGAPATPVGKAGAGGTTADATAPPPGGAGGGAGKVDATPFSPFGSFDVRIVQVDVSGANGPDVASSPSMNAKLRIDVPEPKATKGTWSAVVTPVWGEPALFQATLTDTALVLTGNVMLKGEATSDAWQTISIALGPDKKATGVVTASGQESVYTSGVGYEGKISATLAVGPDLTKPEAKPIAASGFATSYLPWEPLGARFSEPISAEQVATHLTFVSTNSPAGPYLFVAASDGPTGATGALAYPTLWGGPAVSVHLLPGYTDAAGNVGAGFDEPVDVLAVSKPTGAAATFDGSAPADTWGDVQKLSGALCESGACLALGPVANDHCGVASSGVAVRLAPPSGVPVGTGKVKIRYRVLFAVPSGSPAAAQSMTSLAPLSVQVARPGVAPVSHDLGKVPATADVYGFGDFNVGTAWTTLEVALPSSKSATDEIGVAVRIGAQGSSVACAPNAPGGSPILTKVLVDGVGTY
jgi:hypothetical protein